MPRVPVSLACEKRDIMPNSGFDDLPGLLFCMKDHMMMAYMVYQLSHQLSSNMKTSKFNGSVINLDPFLLPLDLKSNNNNMFVRRIMEFFIIRY